ncbi:metallopeptidase family protein [candidate division WWE3 bacterium]|uniref:Metallopeptidase family protein n=1 Tax=candidate division WWE3 bacterium TaxID=2053526 RepID=A0A955LKP3_UNCKA|nr:metallopeptidase family protein [candidate division WWE3 bacterium]
MTPEQFDDLVQEVVENLPEDFKDKFDNVAVVTEIWPTREDLQRGNVGRGMTLFGLYVGIPKTKRLNYSFVLPDKIKIFMGPIMQSVTSEQEARAQIRKTVLHEIGHHFGMNEEEVRKAMH